MPLDIESLNSDFDKLKRELLIFVSPSSLDKINNSQGLQLQTHTNTHYYFFLIECEAIKMLNFALLFTQEIQSTHAKALALKSINQEIINLIIQIQKSIAIKEKNIYEKFFTLVSNSRLRIEKRALLISNNKERLEKSWLIRSTAQPQPIGPKEITKPKFKI